MPDVVCVPVYMKGCCGIHIYLLWNKKYIYLFLYVQLYKNMFTNYIANIFVFISSLLAELNDCIHTLKYQPQKFDQSTKMLCF